MYFYFYILILILLQVLVIFIVFLPFIYFLFLNIKDWSCIFYCNNLQKNIFTFWILI